MRDEWLKASDDLLLRECTLDFHKASGNGGQKVNKTSTAVRLIHQPSGVSVSSAESRSQHENRRHAFKSLRMKIALTIRQEPDPAFRIGDPPVSIHNSAYPLFAASMLDIFAASGCDLKTAGTSLGISASRFAKLLWRDPVLWTEANRMRTACGLPALKPMGGR